MWKSSTPIPETGSSQGGTGNQEPGRSSEPVTQAGGGHAAQLEDDDEFDIMTEEAEDQGNLSQRISVNFGSSSYHEWVLGTQEVVLEFVLKRMLCWLNKDPANRLHPRLNCGAFAQILILVRANLPNFKEGREQPEAS